ncbi:EamA family transporter [Enterobacteriaceae bacterium G50]|nr:EamA family transporter [Enterobacteriaceae bacterium G50]
MNDTQRLLQKKFGNLSVLLTEIGLLILLSFIWGNSFVLTKIAVQSIPPLSLTAFRVTLSALLLTIYMKFCGLSFSADRRVWRFFVIQGLLQCAIPYTLISWGEKEISSGLAGILNATPPVFVLLISMFTGLGSSNLTRRKIMGTGLGLTGVVVIIGYSVLLDTGSTDPLAQLAVLGASFCYALSPLIILRHTTMPPLVITAGSMCCSAMMMIPAMTVIDQPWNLSPTLYSLLSALTLAVICTAIAMIIYFRLVSTVGALVTASGGYLRAGFSVISGIIFLGESISWSVGVGMIFVVAAIVLINSVD